MLATGATLDVTAPAAFSLADFQSLSGGGLVAGTLRAGTGSRLLPGGTGVMGTLSFAHGLNLSAGATNVFDLSPASTAIGAGVNDLIEVAGLLEPSNAVIAVAVSAPLTNGAYRLFNYTGSKASAFHPMPVGNGTRQSWTIDEATPGQVNLVVTGDVYSLRWNSQTSPNWDFNTGTNWFHAAGGTNTVFLDYDTVVFDDNGAATNGIVLVGALKPGAVTVNGASNYTFGGAGRITGAASLLKDGPGVLTLAVTGSDYAAGTVISGGVIRVAQVNILPTNSLTTIAAGRDPALRARQRVVHVPPSPLRATGTVLLTFAGATANNAYLTGASTGFVGTIELTANGIVGSKLNSTGLNVAPGALIRVNTGAQFYASGLALPNPIQLAGAGNNENRGGLRLGPALLSGPIGLTASATIGPDGGTNAGPIFAGVSGNSSLTLGSGNAAGTALFLGSISNGAGTLEVIVSNGTSTVLGTNTYTGGTSLRGGTLVVAEISDSGPSSIANTGLLSFAGGTLRYIGATPVTTYRSISNIGAGRAIFDITNAAATLLLGGAIDGAGGLAKLGKGTLVISNNSVTALQANPGLEVRGGLLLVVDSQINSQLPANNNDYVGRNAGDDATLTLAGSASYNRSNNTLYVADQGGSRGVLNIQDNAAFWGNYRVSLGQNIGATGIINLASGSFTLGNDLYVANSGVGSFHHTGGSYSNFGGTTYVGVNSNTLGRFFQSAGAAYVAGSLAIGQNANANGAFYHTGGDLFVRGEFNLGNNAAGAYGFYSLTGGSVVNSNWHQAGRNGLGLSYLLGGTFDHIAPNQGFVSGNNIGTGVFYIAGAQVNLAGRLGVGWWANSRAEVTIAGSSTVTVGNAGVQFNQGTTATTFSVLNLRSGVLATSNMYKQVTGGWSVVNFDGGTLRALGSRTLLGAGAGGVGALDAAYVYPGGAFIDASNLEVTVTQPLRAPDGNGVAALPAGGPWSGYIGAPHVLIAGGGGTGATAVALFDHLAGTVTAWC